MKWVSHYKQYGRCLCEIGRIVNCVRCAYIRYSVSHSWYNGGLYYTIYMNTDHFQGWLPLVNVLTHTVNRTLDRCFCGTPTERSTADTRTLPIRVCSTNAMIYGTCQVADTMVEWHRTVISQSVIGECMEFANLDFFFLFSFIFRSVNKYLLSEPSEQMVRWPCPKPSNISRCTSIGLGP